MTEVENGGDGVPAGRRFLAAFRGGKRVSTGQPGERRPIARSGKLPLYVQCASLLRNRINRGEWGIGQCIPSISDLAEGLCLAPVTVRQAIALLESEQLLERRQGAGTFVIGRTIPADWLRLGATWDALLVSLRDVEVQVVNVRLSHLQPQLDAEEGRPAESYRFLSRLHRRDGRPYCLINLYLDEEINRLAPLRFDQELVLPALTELAGERIARAWQTLRIGKADPALAEQLEIDVGEPVAHVRRIIADRAGVVIYVAEIAYRGDVIRIDMNLLDGPAKPAKRR